MISRTSWLSVVDMMKVVGSGTAVLGTRTKKWRRKYVWSDSEERKQKTYTPLSVAWSSKTLQRTILLWHTWEIWCRHCHCLAFVTLVGSWMERLRKLSTLYALCWRCLLLSFFDGRSDLQLQEQWTFTVRTRDTSAEQINLIQTDIQQGSGDQICSRLQILETADG